MDLQGTDRTLPSCCSISLRNHNHQRSRSIMKRRHCFIRCGGCKNNMSYNIVANGFDFCCYHVISTFLNPKFDSLIVQTAPANPKEAIS